VGIMHAKFQPSSFNGVGGGDRQKDRRTSSILEKIPIEVYGFSVYRADAKKIMPKMSVVGLETVMFPCNGSLLRPKTMKSVLL